ncbi:hypothetical protein WA1_29020 [Scytonema hofmannii PCC 7110]|uniref:Uncharacterized protein n=1 Tax=Scytonema hofmannii PCC 7110 TaxID=128403 RepID=A0A139X5V4_9CYAN|nr:caspase family protein [Scytonema hofmannii]KYC40002.1 hypothetical protein WA1_29020 [Scytonema hofmannii PCC 7110]
MCPRAVGTSRSTYTQQTSAAKLWLLLVGVNQYQDERLPNLNYSALDCQGLAKALVGATEHFPQKEIKIYHDFAPQLPYLDTVRASLQEISTAARPQDTILFYFSGHGIFVPNTYQTFLCLANTQKDDILNTGLAIQELLQLLGKCPAQNQLVWLDACHSGGMTLRGATVAEPLLNATRQLVEVLQKVAATSKGFYALLSCDTDQQSWEFPELGHGVFTYYLMRGLQGEAADSQGAISADGLYRYVYHQTLQYIDKTNQQLRLINQQKRGKGDTQLFREYPLQTPKRIVEGVGELILGSIGAIEESRPKRQALVAEGWSGTQTTLAFCKVLRSAGGFELEYLPRQGKATAKEVREAIQEFLYLPNQKQHKTEKPATVLLYLRGRLEETPTGEVALVLSEDVWLSRAWLRQQLRRSQAAQQIIILDFLAGESDRTLLQEWIEDLQIGSEKAQCIIAANSPRHNLEQFADALVNTLTTASKPNGLSIAGWITQLQVRLAGAFPLHIWLSGTQGIIEIIPAFTETRSQKKAAALDLGICPYKGLEAFGEEDVQYFYGRETLTQQLINDLARNSFLAVVGASGSGKSSVVQAGLMTQLRSGKQLPGSENWWIKSFRPSARPLEALSRRLAASGQEDKGTRGRGEVGGEMTSSSPHLILEGLLYQGVEGFVYWVRSRPEPMVVLVVDQFEELFTLAPDEDRKRFLELVLGAIKYASDRFKLVITLRADFIAPCLEVPALAILLQQSSVLVPPRLSHDDYRRVIVNPAEQVGLKVESGLVEILLQELNDSVGNLPLLEFVLQQLWEYRQEGELTLAAYQQHLGGIKGALEQKAQAVYDGLDSLARDCARWIFLSLTQLGEGTEDTKRRVLKSDLVVKKYPAPLVERTLQALTAVKLIVVNLEDEGKVGGDKGDKGNQEEIPPALSLPANAVTIEVAHEILIRHWSTLRWWLEENRSKLRLQRQIEQAAVLWKHKDEQSDFLLRGVRLAEAEEIYVKYTDELSDDVQRFIAACLEERQRQQLEQKKRLRQAQRAVAVMSVLGVTATGFGGLAYFKQQAAQVREVAALNASSEALLLSNRQMEALIASVKAGEQFKQVFAPAKDVELATVATLQQAVYQTQEINRLQSHAQQVNAVSFSPGRKLLASASDDSTIKIWSEDGKLISTFPAQEGRVTSIAFSPDGKFLASGSTDKTINIYSIDGKVVQILTGHSDIVTSVSFGTTLVETRHGSSLHSFSERGRQGGDFIIASGSRDKTVKLWRMDGGLINTWNAHNGWVNSVTFSPDGKFLVSGGEDNVVKLWNVADAKLMRTFTGHTERITRVKFSPDGKIIASASGDKSINLWKLDGKLWQTLGGKKGHTQQVNSISFSPDGQLVVSAAADGTIKFWSLDGTLLAAIKGHDEQVRDVNVSPDGKILASASDDKTIRFWNLTNSSRAQEDSIYSVSFSPDGKVLASAGWNGEVKLWQHKKMTSASLLKAFKSEQDIIYAAIFSSDGKTLATAGDNKSIKIWNLRNNQLIKTLTGHEKRVTSISFSPDNEIIASGSADKTIKLWRLADGKLLKTLSGHNDEVTSVGFSRDGKMLASGSYDNTVKLWGVDGTLVKTLKGHSLAIAHLSFSPDGKTIASASWDNTIKLWKVPDGGLVNTLTGHTNGVKSLSFSSNSQILASGSADGTIKLWNAMDGTLMKTLLGHTGEVNSVSFSPDNKLLVSGGNAGMMLWNLDLDNLMQQGCTKLKNYLKNNPNVSESDRNICQASK